MRARWALAAVVLALAGCESSQEKSARLAKAARAQPQEHGVVVKARNPDVQVLRSAVLSDRYGTAVAVEVRLRGGRAQAELPISFAVEGAGGRQLYANDLPGLASSLTHVSLLRPGERVWWVNDQVRVGGARRVTARVGRSRARAEAAAVARAPRLEPTGLELDGDSSGSFTRGQLRNRSAVEQRNVTVFAVAERGSRVVAAGRAGIERLKPRGKALFKIYWIGDPKGARVRVFAPPVTLAEEEAK